MKAEVEQLAGRLYIRYCRAVGGKAFNGDPLPTWSVFRTDPAKEKQALAWIEVAHEARDPGLLQGPVPHRLQNIRNLLDRDITPGNIDALHAEMQALLRLLENPEIEVPVELFLAMEEKELRLAVSAFASSVLMSAINRAAIERAQQRRIIVPRSTDR